MSCPGPSHLSTTSHRIRIRKVFNIVMLSLTGACAFITVAVLVGILGYLLWNGASSVNWDFFTKLPKPVGDVGGGMANAIVGSAKLLLIASLFGMPIGVIAGCLSGGIWRYSILFHCAIYGRLTERRSLHRHRNFRLRFDGGAHEALLDPGRRLRLGIMMIPIAVRSTEEFLRAVPRNLREGAMALGASKWRTILTVIIPAAFQGIVTGLMLDLARVAGETAPLLFTAFSNRFWSPGWNQPIASLPVMIFTYAISPYDEWHRQAWAAGLVLLGLVFLVNIAA